MYRIIKGLSEVEFCNQTKIDQTLLSNIEHGRQNISTLLLLKIATALDVEVNDILQ